DALVGEPPVAVERAPFLQRRIVDAELEVRALEKDALPRRGGADDHVPGQVVDRRDAVLFLERAEVGDVLPELLDDRLQIRLFLVAGGGEVALRALDYLLRQACLLLLPTHHA